MEWLLTRDIDLYVYIAVYISLAVCKIVEILIYIIHLIAYCFYKSRQLLSHLSIYIQMTLKRISCKLIYLFKYMLF